MLLAGVYNGLVTPMPLSPSIEIYHDISHLPCNSEPDWSAFTDPSWLLWPFLHPKITDGMLIVRARFVRISNSCDSFDAQSAMVMSPQ
jgi:hypothetical protein